MGMLIAALAAFVGTHFLLSHPLRASLVARMGAMAFQGLYSLVAIATFVWIVFAFQAAPIEEPLWPAGEGIWATATVLMLFGSILFAGSLIGNPALPGPPADTAKPARGVFAITRHPMMWGFALWALVHLLVSPQPRVIALTVAMGFLALAGSKGQDAKKAAIMGEGWRDWASRTSFVPFGNQFAGRSSWAATWPGLTVLLAGILLWLLATYLHPMFGAPTAGIWLWMG